ncbi:molybdopterin converting factor subunit 1 [Nitratireductor basaltis]|uniref:Molybdopterin synthase sulfur carrier subunit n=1 Tax=Nitratireductor basaltis TaxID=472175 RepID=A0A084UC37_9HYPH|nr:molybdopterin converting factor subunit 1 [Nitratireductor basaltis]KFB10523.1 Molybdopterin converting factor subunit 1 [Nitratireductor basaltis]
MKLVYFAWVRERIGKNEEEISVPHEVTDIAGLLDWLADRGDGYAAALEQRQVIRVAVNHRHVTHDTRLPADGEIALFPPMTGG